MLVDLIILLTALSVVVVSALPLVRTDAGLIRVCDFPRPQFLVVGAAALIAMTLWSDWRDWSVIGIGLACGAAVVGQAIRIAPYTVLMRKESRPAKGDAPERELSLLIVNVKKSNRRSDPLVDLIVKHQPDIVFAVEIDRWWQDQLSTVAETYPHVTTLPQDDGYGLMFLSRLTVASCEVRRLVEPNIPSLKAQVRLHAGQSFWFYGLHPQPPGAIQDAHERNTELLYVAREIGADREPSLVAGDLNDVAWSRTNDRFLKISGMLDPRVGRGVFATFHARYWIARWPIDHLFHSPDFAIAMLRVLPDVGSDHLPVFARLQMAAPADRPPEAT
jgi:endonuclease/exonuclease/phosphatase (EEP) superfamily protein YafD